MLNFQYKRVIFINLTCPNESNRIYINKEPCQSCAARSVFDGRIKCVNYSSRRMQMSRMPHCVATAKVVALTCLTAVVFAARGFGDARSECNALTGNIHTRIAWREGGDQINGGSNTIKGFDSKTGDIHPIWSGSCIKSVLAYGGQKLLVTSGDYKVYVINWDGDNKKQLANGSVSDGWRDPNSGTEYAIYRASGKGTGGGIYRVDIDNPSNNKKIYDGKEGHSVYPWFQISADGKRAASFFPWSSGGVLNLETGELSKVANGCWSGMASDNSYKWFHLDGSHKKLVTFNGTSKIRSVNAMPPISGDQIYCPRAAEGPSRGGRFFVLSGGYPGFNENGNGVEIFLGKWNSGYSGIDGWARITNNNKPDHHPTAWIGVESLGPPPSPEFKSIAVTPDGGRVAINESITFEIQTLDQTGQHIDPPGTIAWKVSGGGSLTNTSNESVTFQSDGQTGTFELTGELNSIDATALIRVFDPSQFHLRVNCGGEASGDWESDGAYVQNGNTYDFNASFTVSDIADPPPADVLTTCRHKEPGYSFAVVPDGVYRVRLYCGDTYGNGRAMTITIEGREVLTGYAPPVNTAEAKEFIVTVSDGDGLQIAVTNGDGNDAFVNALEIVAESPTTISLHGFASRDLARSFHVRRCGDTFRFFVGLHQHYTLELYAASGRLFKRFAANGSRSFSVKATRLSRVTFARLVTGREKTAYIIGLPLQ